VCEILFCSRILIKDTRKRSTICCVLLKLDSNISISFLFQVGVPEVRQYRVMPDTLQLSFLSLSTTLFPMHFSNGQLVIKCTAHVSTLYRETTEVQLTSRTREPIPERGTLRMQVKKFIPRTKSGGGNTLSLLWSP
jgi:hypothetical protein